MSSLIEGFALYNPPVQSLPPNQCIVGLPPGTRLHRIVRLPRGWLTWLATKDFINGTYLVLHDNGRVDNITTRADEGDDIFLVRPSDEEIRHGR